MGHRVARRTVSIEESKHLIRNQTHILPACASTNYIGSSREKKKEVE
jgi:hypothetical protein